MAEQETLKEKQLKDAALWGFKYTKFNDIKNRLEDFGIYLDREWHETGPYVLLNQHKAVITKIDYMNDVVDFLKYLEYGRNEYLEAQEKETDSNKSGDYLGVFNSDSFL